MNKIKILILIALPIIFFSACSKDVTTNDLSRITYFANLNLEGDQTMVVPCGTTFTEPGVTAEENGTAVDVTTTSLGGLYFGESDVNTDISDIYSISYSATNSDGFSGSTSRQVLVVCNGDMVADIGGFYTASVIRGDADPVPNLNYVIINKTADNTYQLSHAIGGYYDLGRKYGPGYAALGAVVSFDGASYSVTNGTFPIWGNVVEITEFTVDAANKTISYTGTGNFGNGTFTIVLKQTDF